MNYRLNVNKNKYAKIGKFIKIPFETIMVWACKIRHKFHSSNELNNWSIASKYKSYNQMLIQSSQYLITWN